MTDTNTLAPTDSEILDAAEDFRSQYTHGGTTFDEFDEIGFTRAVLAKWGAPAPVGAEPVAFIPPRAFAALQDPRYKLVQHQVTLRATKIESDWIGLFTAAQVQAMLASAPSAPTRQPLTDDQIGAAVRAAHIAFCLDKFQTFERAIVHFTEKAHGIAAQQGEKK